MKLTFPVRVVESAYVDVPSKLHVHVISLTVYSVVALLFKRDNQLFINYAEWVPKNESRKKLPLSQANCSVSDKLVPVELQRQRVISTRTISGRNNVAVGKWHGDGKIRAGSGNLTGGGGGCIANVPFVGW